MGKWKDLANWGYNGESTPYTSSPGYAMRSYTNTSDEDELLHTWWIYLGTGNARYVSVNSDKTGTTYTDGSGNPFTAQAVAVGTDGVTSTANYCLRTKNDGTTVEYLDGIATVDNKVGRSGYTSSGFQCYTVKDSECEKYEFTFDKPVVVAAGKTVKLLIDFNESVSGHPVITDCDTTAKLGGGTITAMYFTLTIDPNGGTYEGSTNSATHTGLTGSTVSIATPVHDSKAFGSWQLDGGGSYSNGTYTFGTSNGTLTAGWGDTFTYTVSFNKNGYTVTNMPSSQTKTHGVALTLSSKTPNVTTTESINTHTVTLDANGGTVSSTTLQAKSTVSYVFDQWGTTATGGTCYDPGDSFTQNKNTTLYLLADSVETPQSVTLPTPTRSGYKFIGWSTAVGKIIDSSYISNSSNKLLVDGAVEAAWYAYSDYDSSYYRPDDIFVAYDYLKNNNGVTVPVIYKTDTEYVSEGPDYDDPFYYSGKETIDGVTYDTWRKICADGSITWDSTNTVYVYTNEIVTENDGTTFFTGSITPTSNMTLYANWEAQGLAYIGENAYTIWIGNGSSWEQYMPYIGNGSSWNLYS